MIQWGFLPGSYLFFAVLALGFAELAARKFQSRSLLRMVQLGLKSELIKGPGGAVRVLRSVQIVLGASLAVIALMGPQGEARPQGPSGEREIVQETPLTEEGEEKVAARRRAHDVIFLIDASASMDVTDTRMGVSRLEYAKEIVDEIVGQLKGETVALYAFTSELTTVVPATMDYLYTRLQLRRVQINEGDAAGTDLMEALDQVMRHHAAGGGEKTRTLVLLTDGGDTRMEALRGEERQRELDAIVSRLGQAEGGLTTFCVGLGSHEGTVIPGLQFEGQPVIASLDESLLKALAEKGEGLYCFANEHSALSIADRVISHIETEQREIEEELVLPMREIERTVAAQGPVETVDYFRWPLTLAILILGSELILSRIQKGLVTRRRP